MVGQHHIIGEGSLLRRAIEADRLFSSILSSARPGPVKQPWHKSSPIHTQAQFETMSAVLAGVAELRRVIADARTAPACTENEPFLFIDEVHRWNKAQQDALLPHVETGMVTLIGATTENPYFDVISALVSRSRLFQLEPLSEAHLDCSSWIGRSVTPSAVMAAKDIAWTKMRVCT